MKKIDKKNQTDDERSKAIIELVNNSPYYKHIRMKLIEYRENECVMRMEAGDEHINVYDAVHGGAIASLADSTCGLSLIPSLGGGEFAVTQNLIVNYFKAVTKGALTGKGRVVHRGKTTAVLEADIYNEAGELVARAQTTHAIRKR
jgi:uncharacterized protein (TIGR00369 family)